jgi:N,N'-diacetyllegionaminate synthase
MLKRYELNKRLLDQIHKSCKKNRIKPLFSVFDLESLSKLKKYRYSYLKIPSGEITNYPLLKEIGKLKKKIFLSTGMATLKEIKYALETLIKFGTKNKDIFILHCHSDYPSRFRDLNLIRIKKLNTYFPNTIGYSDHSIGSEATIAAVALGAKVIEKHVTLKTSMIGPDHSSSLPISHLNNLISSIRNIEKALGTNDFKRSKSENKNKFIVRKSLVANTDIKKGDKFSMMNLTCKRPGNGISPVFWNKVLNKRAKINFNKDDLIKL